MPAADTMLQIETPVRSREDDIPTSSTRSRTQVLDLTVQNSVVELLREYGVSAAPVPSAQIGALEQEREPLAAQVSFYGAKASGTLVLRVARQTLEKTQNGSAGRYNEYDWIRELCNQLIGRIRNRLARYQVELRAAVPTLLERGELRRLARNHPDQAYVFRAVSGFIAVWLTGDLSQVDLVLSSDIEVVEEGEVILF